MNGRRKDIDPSTELAEEDDEQTLPELEPEAAGDAAIDLAAGTGSLAVGRAAIARHARHAPSSPGVYRMIDGNGEVLYVGKAKNIRKRIVAYTRPTGYDPRIERMIAATAALEFVSTATETEALLLEANLIKRLRPRFNVLLRDDKSFPYILITADHWAPQILKHRGARSRPGKYYGPFASVWAVNRTVTALQRAFLLRSCSDGFFESRTRPCLLYQIKRCSGPCTREIDFAAYTELVREANDFLSGKSRAVKEELAHEMEAASEALDFERAAIYRDRLAALSAVQGHQGINPRSLEEADVFAVHQDGGFTCIEVFFFRTGQNWGNRAYFPKADRSLPAGEVLGAFLAQFYDDKPCPRCILLSHEIEERALLAEALSTKSGIKIEIGVPQRGERKELVDHALANAREALARKLADTSSQRRLIEALAETFGLSRPPRRIEVYDNSHIQGTNAVGAMVVAGAEGFQKNQYRKFNIRSADLTPGDDFGMMREVLTRRFKRLLDEAPRANGMSQNGGVDAADLAAVEPHAPSPSPLAPLPSPLGGEGGEDRRSEPGEGMLATMVTTLVADPSPASLPSAAQHPLPQGERVTEQAERAPEQAENVQDDESDAPSPWPDLVLIDGGRGQLTAAQETLAALGLTDMPLVGIAKGPDRDAGMETFFAPGREPFKLKPRDPVLYFVQRLRVPDRVTLLTDTTWAKGAGAVQDTYTLVRKGIRKLLKQLGYALPGKRHGLADAAQRLIATYLEADRKADIAWADPAARAAQLQALVADADAALDLALAQSDDPEVRATGWLLTKILGDDLTLDAQGAAQIGQGTAPDRIISVTDPEMRHGRKSAAHRFDGFKVAVSTELDSELILDIADVPAPGSDGEHLLPTIGRVEAHADVIVARVMGDGAYGAGKNRAACATYPGHPVDLLAPVERPADPEVHKSAFQIDLAAQMATCPQGQTVTGTTATVHGEPVLQFHFARATCETCPLFARCVRSKEYGRTVTVDAYESYRQAARRQQETAEFKALYPLRSRVERKQAELVGHGLRETRYLGRAKRRLQRLWTAAAVNLKRLFKLAETRSADLAAACSRVHSQRPAGRPA